MGMSDPAPNRRWFRFSLRTLFMVVMVVAIASWGGYGFNWMRQRRQLIENRMPGVYFEFYAGGPESSGRLPAILRLLGEKGCRKLFVRVDADQRERQAERIQNLFPEASDVRVSVW
jgi:hypothetical protein